MKVLHVYKTYFPVTNGGVERVINDLTNFDDVESKILSVYNGDYFTENVNGIEVFFFPSILNMASNPFFNIFDKRVSFLFNWADIIHYHFPWPTADLLSLTRFGSKPYVITYHSDVVKQKALDLLYSPLKKIFLRNAKFVIATSPNYVSSSMVLRSLQNVTVVPLGLDDNLPKFLTPYIHDKPYFFFIGVHRYYKGLKFLVQAALQIDCDVIIAGEGPETHKLLNKAKDLGANNCKFIGRISDEEKMAYLRGALGFVLPSHLRSEAFGVCLLEAMSMGIPLITTNIASGMSFVNQNGVTGFCVDPESPADLVRAMNSLLDDETLRIRMGENAKKRYQNIFTASAMRLAYHKIYTQTVMH